MTVNKFLEWFIWGGLFLILFIPLYVSDFMFFPFITGKNFAFRIIVELITGSWIVLALRNSHYRPKKSLLLYGATAFVAIIAVADSFSENPFKSFWSNYERMEGFVGLVHVFGFFLVAGSVLNSSKLWERFWQTSLGVSVILSGHGILQLVGSLDIHQGSSRLDASFGNSTYYAVYLLFHIFIAAFFAVRRTTHEWARWVYGALALLNIFMLYHTATRGAILGLIGGVFLATILISILEKHNKILKKSSIGILIVSVLIPIAVFAMRDSVLVRESPVLSRFSSISLTEQTTRSRFMVWNMAWQGFKERPLLGWGQESFNFVFNKYYNPKMYDQEPWFDRAHNVFFDWLIAGGILGFLAYLSLFVFALYYLWRPSHNESHTMNHQFSITEKSILTGLLAGYFFQNIFVFDNLTSYLLFFSLLAFIHSQVATRYVFHNKENAHHTGRENNQKKNKEEGLSNDVVFAPIVIIATLFSMYTFNYQPIAANKNLIQALQRQAKPETNLEFFKKSISRNSMGTTEAREQLAMSASRILSLNVEQGVKNQFIVFASDELKKQVDQNPGDARHNIFLGSFLNQIGDFEQSIKYLEQASKLTPNKQQVYFELANAYLNKNNRNNAVEVAKKAFDLENNYDMARVFYATTLIYNGDKKLSEEILKPLYDNNTLDEQSGFRILRAYADAKDFEGAEKILNFMIEKNPTNYQNYTSLAALELEKGNRKKSIDALQKAIEVNPDFKTQGEYYINEIQAGRNP